MVSLSNAAKQKPLLVGLALAAVTAHLRRRAAAATAPPDPRSLPYRTDDARRPRRRAASWQRLQASGELPSDSGQAESASQAVPEGGNASSSMAAERDARGGWWVLKLLQALSLLAVGMVPFAILDDPVYSATPWSISTLLLCALAMELGNRLWAAPDEPSTPGSNVIATSQYSAVSGSGAPPDCAPNLSGTWLRDAARSDTLDAAIRTAKLNGIFALAVKLVRGIHINQDAETFEMAVFSRLPVLKIIERYPMNGEPRRWKRRDLRAGKHSGFVEPTKHGVRLVLAWGQPLEGNGVDEYCLVSTDELIVRSRMFIGGTSCAFDTVYVRK